MPAMWAGISKNSAPGWEKVTNAKTQAINYRLPEIPRRTPCATIVYKLKLGFAFARPALAQFALARLALAQCLACPPKVVSPKLLSTFAPLIQDCFASPFAQITDPQKLGWPEIRSGHDVLISAPTSSGKTLAAFLICLDHLVSLARQGVLQDQTSVLSFRPSRRSAAIFTRT